MKNNIYSSLDIARSELAKRLHDSTLRDRITTELGEYFMPQYASSQRVVSTRQLASADNGFSFFYQCAKYLGAKPLAQEYLGDVFVHFNEEKKGLGRLRVELEGGSRATVDIMDFHQNEKTALANCVLKSGENLVAFHHTLLDIDGYDIEKNDNTAWYRSIGKASDYYYFLLLHFVAHGVLFESFYDEGGTNEDAFTHEVVYPTIERITDTFGLAPLIVRAYPEEQSDDEDFYWWSHSPQVNAHILKYAHEHTLPLKPL
jgi:hypothetical protein